MADRSARPLDAPARPEGRPGTDRCRGCDTRRPSAMISDWLAFQAEYKHRLAPEPLDAPWWRRGVAATPARSQKGRRRLGGGVAASSDWDDTSARTGLRGRFICSRAKRTRPSSTHPRMPGSQTAPCTRWQMLSTSWGQLQALTFGAPIVIRRLGKPRNRPRLLHPLKSLGRYSVRHNALSDRRSWRARMPPVVRTRLPERGHRSGVDRLVGDAMHDQARRARSDAQRRRGIARQPPL